MEKELTDRQKKILSIIVDSYVETVEPVGSRMISKRYNLDLSPATIRNEMSDLEEAGLVMHPHTSAGRIPTDLGYRYFIDYLLKREEISQHLAADISKQFRSEMEGLNDLIEKASHILAAMTEQTGIVSYPEMKDLSFGEISLHRLDLTHVLVIWVTTTGFVQNQVVDMREEISEDILKKITNFFNKELAGWPLCEMPQEISKRLSQHKDSLYLLYKRALQIVEGSLKKVETTRICLEGSSHILEKPEFQNIDKSRLLFQALEKRDQLFNLLRSDQHDQGVQVHVGRENKWEEIWGCSLITANYKYRDKVVGVIGILGPSRMRYGTVISFVDYLSRELSQALERWC